MIIINFTGYNFQMSVCAQKSVVLQRETIVGVQETVDESVKVFYCSAYGIKGILRIPTFVVY